MTFSGSLPSRSSGPSGPARAWMAAGGVATEPAGRPGVQRRGVQAAARRSLASALVSVAGLVGRPVHGQDGEQVGTLADVVVRNEPGHPRVAGFVVRIGARRAWLHVEDVAGVEQGQLRLLTSRFDLVDVERRAGEIQLVGDVVDHQMVDVLGVRVVRASDLYLAAPTGAWCLVGVDVSWRTFLRRSLPGRLGRRASPGQVLDWADVQPFGVAAGPATGPAVEGTGGTVPLSGPQAALRRLRPADLADLLEDLGRAERRELLDSLDPEAAADALEEMNASDLAGVLRDAPVERAAQLLATMESDEAAEALRDMPDDEREQILQAMPDAAAGALRTLVSYGERTAGGLMTCDLVLVGPGASVADAVAALCSAAAHRDQTPGVVVVDADGRVVDDLAALELLGLDGDRPVVDLAAPPRSPRPVCVRPGAGLDEVVETMTDNRGSSVLVVDDDDRPVGRILADDVIDALVHDGSGPWPWQRRIGATS